MTPAQERRLSKRRMPALGPASARMNSFTLYRIERNYYSALFAGLSYPLGRALYIENRILNGDCSTYLEESFDRMCAMHWSTARRWLQHWRRGGSLKALRYTAQEWRQVKAAAKRTRRERLRGQMNTPTTRHLSMTGNIAGVRLCGTIGPAWHVMYLHTTQWRDPDLCLDCIQVCAQCFLVEINHST